MSGVGGSHAQAGFGFRVSGFRVRLTGAVVSCFVFPGEGFRFRGQDRRVLRALGEEAVAELSQSNREGVGPRLRAEVGQLLSASGFRCEGCDVTHVPVEVQKMLRRVCLQELGPSYRAKVIERPHQSCN